MRLQVREPSRPPMYSGRLRLSSFHTRAGHTCWYYWLDLIARGPLKAVLKCGDHRVRAV